MEAKMSSLPYAQLCRQFSLDEILSVTQNFDDALVIGKGGFGKVYKATIKVENGETLVVAIKRLNFDSSQGATEFWAEIEMLTKLRHCNLVSLIGYCNDNPEMILIYEFMPHGTLDGHLHKYGTSLSWVQRLKISIGAARGLHYLHTGTGTQHGVIHRDVKSSNILLDEDYAAKISDFGLSKIGPINASGTYVNTLIRGTFGYLDPEYFLTGRLTRKSDVFAFGVVLFELLCGRAALDNSLDEDRCSLAKWAHESIEEGKVHEIIDSNIKSQISSKCLKVFVQIANRCLSSESKKRPTMAEILVDLELSLALQNKFDNRVKPSAGILSIGRIIKWPFISSDVNSAQTERESSKIREDNIEATSLSKESTADHGEVVLFGEMLDHLNHVAAQRKSLDEDNINYASLSQEHSDNHHQVSSSEKIHILADNLKKFSFGDLQKATRNFNTDMKLGEGEFGEVFEGWIDTNTTRLLRVAVRRFYQSKIQHHLKVKFVDMIFLRELNHGNVVEVLGYCFEDKKLFLIYEFVENGCLDSHLFTKDKMPLPWKTRVQITVGIAEALLFLHSTFKKVDNFPIKLHQILLDKNFNPMVSDFDAARLAHGLSYKEKSIDPLFHHPIGSSFSNNSQVRDIMSAFGVVLFQILTGERVSKTAIANLRQNMWNLTGEDRKESLRRALDPRLPNIDDATIIEAVKLAAVALDCLDDPSYTLDIALDLLRELQADMIKRWPF